jgi:hypothetical protein
MTAEYIVNQQEKREGKTVAATRFELCALVGTQRTRRITKITKKDEVFSVFFVLLSELCVPTKAE